MTPNISVFIELMRKVKLLSAIFFISGLTIISCKKKGELTPDFDNGDLNVVFTDTFTLNTTVFREDSLRTDISSLNLLGIYHDPIFGLASASFYSQITLRNLNVDFGTTDVTDIDSLVLELPYAEDGIYGNAQSPLTVTVYEVTSDFPTEEEIYSNTILNHSLTPIATKTFVPNITDSISVNGETKPPQLRINLDVGTFGEKIISRSGQDELSNDASFKQYIKGLYITVSEDVNNASINSGEGAIVYLNTNSSFAGLTMYYSDSLTYSFLLNSESIKYNTFDHNYSGTTIEEALSGTSTDSTLVYVQAMAGVKTKIELPSVESLAELGLIAVNEARLVIPVENNSGTTYAPIAKMAIVGIDENGESVFVIDYAEGEDHVGGSLDETTNEYTFNITRHVHDLVYNNTANFGLYLVSSGSSISANRSVITSAMHPTDKMKLEITYSKL